MVNYYDKNRFISKSELARLADVSPRTFTRYLATRRHILDATGITSFKRSRGQASDCFQKRSKTCPHDRMNVSSSLSHQLHGFHLFGRSPYL